MTKTSLTILLFILIIIIITFVKLKLVAILENSEWILYFGWKQYEFPYSIQAVKFMLYEFVGILNGDLGVLWLLTTLKQDRDSKKE